MSAFTRAFTAHPIVLFRKNPRFYLQYDGFWLFCCAATLLTFTLTGFRPLMAGPHLWFAAAFPVLLFGLIWAHLIIHNCTHGNLPKSVNRFVGEILGLIVLVRYASWGVIHMRHHKHSDDRVLDPHPNFPSFWKTVANTVVSVERQLFEQYFEVWGDTKEMREREKNRARVSYGTNVALGIVWAWVLGPWFFSLVFIPANVLAGLFVIHFNWVTHNGEAAQNEVDMKPVDLKGPGYRLGNALFCGIYAHEVHHQKPYLFNPARY